MRMEAAISVLVNTSNFNHTQQAGGDQHVRGIAVDPDQVILAALNADLVTQLRHVQHILGALQRNVDDFYFVSLTAITFGK